MTKSQPHDDDQPSSSCFPWSSCTGKHDDTVVEDETAPTKRKEEEQKEEVMVANDDFYHVVKSSRGGDRQVSYVCIPSELSDNEGTAAKTAHAKQAAACTSTTAARTAIVYFYPLSGCSAMSLILAPVLQTTLKRNCCFIVVDRPGCGGTSDLSTTGSSSHDRHDHPEQFALDRIRGHVQDVLDVLQAEGVGRVYSLGVCIGHPYAVELCRTLLAEKSPETVNKSPELLGLTLIAPFVSTACPTSWGVARLGAFVPRFVMTSCVHGGVAVGSALMPHVIRPSMLKRLIPPEEQAEFGWTDQDFETMCQQALQLKASSGNNRAKAVEAQLGVASIWQAEVCDKFAEENGIGLVLDDIPGKDHALSSPSKPLVPVRVHASPHDKLAIPTSIDWVARRCYGGADVVSIHDNINSHEAMTFFGGPPHNPSLLLEAASAWSVLREEP